MGMRKVYRQVAKKYGVTAAEVKKEIQVSIDTAYRSPPEDGGVTEAWQRQVPRAGKTPTSDELIRFALHKIKSEER